MSWTFIPATVWFMMVDLFPCKWLNFDRSKNWISIPANIVWISIDELIQYSYIHCLNCWFELKFPFDYCTFIPFDYWLELLFLQNVVWFMIVDLVPCIVWILIDRWIESVFPRTLFEFRSVKWISDSMFELLTRTDIFLLINDLNFYSCKTLFDLWLLTWTVISLLLFDRWFCSIVPAKLLNRYSWANVWIFIDDLNRYSREHCWTVIPERTFEFWSMNCSNIPAKLLTWTVIPEQTIEFWSLIWSNIPTKLLTWANDWIFIDDLKRMFEFWSIIDLIQYFPRQFWVDFGWLAQLFPSERLIQ